MLFDLWSERSENAVFISLIVLCFQLKKKSFNHGIVWQYKQDVFVKHECPDSTKVQNSYFYSKD